MRNLTKILWIPFMAMALVLGSTSLSLADGIIEDKDTIENRGPGNLDAPMEKTPKPTPKMDETTASDTTKKSEKKAEKAAKKEAEAKTESK